MSVHRHPDSTHRTNGDVLSDFEEKLRSVRPVPPAWDTDTVLSCAEDRRAEPRPRGRRTAWSSITAVAASWVCGAAVGVLATSLAFGVFSRVGPTEATRPDVTRVHGTTQPYPATGSNSDDSVGEDMIVNQDRRIDDGASSSADRVRGGSHTRFGVLFAGVLRKNRSLQAAPLHVLEDRALDGSLAVYVHAGAERAQMDDVPLTSSPTDYRRMLLELQQ